MSQYSVTQYGSHRGGYHSPYPIRPPPPGTHPPHLHMPMAPQFPQPFDPRQRQRFPPWQQEQPLPMENIGQFSVPLISGSQPFPPPYRPQPFSPGFSVGAPPSLMPPGVPPHSGQVGTGEGLYTNVCDLILCITFACAEFTLNIKIVFTYVVWPVARVYTSCSSGLAKVAGLGWGYPVNSHTYFLL